MEPPPEELFIKACKMAVKVSLWVILCGLVFRRVIFFFWQRFRRSYCLSTEQGTEEEDQGAVESSGEGGAHGSKSHAVLQLVEDEL